MMVWDCVVIVLIYSKHVRAYKARLRGCARRASTGLCAERVYGVVRGL